MNGALKITLAASLVAGLAACGNDDERSGPLGVLAQTASQVVAQRRAADQPVVAPKSPQEAAAEALRVNPGPLIQAGFESLDRTQVMALTGQNGALRTYMTPAEEALILRGGMLVGTRGLGHDLSVAEPQTETLIRAGATGTGVRIMRYFAGDGVERPLQFSCTVGAGPRPGVTVESCQGHGTSFQNSYMVAGGQIAVSRQWIGPNLGYVTIQTLRP
ncbi:YjbF family lipoprotein [Paracoccus sediminis]|uniref:Group 4 capsule polysaccharide lipoprotein gfcB, YjbF n=1 Tax=Paracoccus sediminis TaxID=1214787 RepID=A0A238WFD1_9RHOB|nr:YjbF family lipoprotein [Paracoccus sediminis]TBN50872.1 YjbF family lipoprotein [Paracoccus sediminis]SNR45296.1 Group 4 capsule polysaccharide lipoprotein gfcB, YjbF [Paracoccus sediminis]